MHETFPDNPALSANEVARSIFLTSEAFEKDYTRFRSLINRVAPVRALFTITETPKGFAPEKIREQWIGVTLPMRCSFTPQEGAAILARDALEALRDERPEAYNWWKGYYANRASDLPVEGLEEFPEFLSNVSFLVFDYRCGEASFS